MGLPYSEWFLNLLDEHPWLSIFIIVVIVVLYLIYKIYQGKK